VNTVITVSESSRWQAGCRCCNRTFKLSEDALPSLIKTMCGYIYLETKYYNYINTCIILGYICVEATISILPQSFCLRGIVTVLTSR